VNQHIEKKYNNHFSNLKIHFIKFLHQAVESIHFSLTKRYKFFFLIYFLKFIKLITIAVKS
jgi:hypothetical protein